MTDGKPVRVDKFLWAVRIYKTRSIASEACRKGRISVNSAEAKPSRIIAGNDIITVRKPPATFTYKVLNTLENRIAAKLVSLYLEDLTSEEEKAKLEISHTSMGGIRDRGAGRPTKKERRLLDRLKDDIEES